MLQVSEWVSSGHPDKVADCISSYILDRYLEIDPLTRYALEVQIKNQYVRLGGEITSKAHFTTNELAHFCRDAVNKIGYTAEYQKKFGTENTICGDDLIVDAYISIQSPDIAQGVDRSGWGDQGIFFGMAVASPETNYMPHDWWLARKIGKHLYDNRIAGLDIKTQVSINDGNIDEVVVAIPMTEKHYDYDIINAVKYCCGERSPKNIYLNGTGKFLQHGPKGDCGTTGRKLVVDFYGGNCKIGGGSPWTKDGTKADLTLNLLARKAALNYIKVHPECKEAYCAISCRIGSPEILIVLTDCHGNEIISYKNVVYPDELIQEFELRKPRFFDMCMNGLFS